MNKTKVKELVKESRRLVKVYDHKLDLNIENGDEMMALIVIARDLAKVDIR